MADYLLINSTDYLLLSAGIDRLLLAMGEEEQVAVYSPDDEAGVFYAVDITTGNLLLFYKKIDPLPYSVTDSARWNDGFDLPYTASALALALSAEDDEYDRYRAWIYEFISNSVADSLRNMAINKNVR